MKTLIAVTLAVLIGAACRWFEIPVPAPPRISGALLILAVTLGYVLTDLWIVRRAARPGETGVVTAPGERERASTLSDPPR